MAELKQGDTVRLKSGGPKMTIGNIDKYNYADYESAKCDWFIEEKGQWKNQNAVFPLHSLEKA